MRETQRLSMSRYCPKSPYPLYVAGIIRKVTNVEDELNHATTVKFEPIKVSIPNYQKPRKYEPGLYMFVKSILP